MSSGSRRWFKGTSGRQQALSKAKKWASLSFRDVCITGQGLATTLEASMSWATSETSAKRSKSWFFKTLWSPTLRFAAQFLSFGNSVGSKKTCSWLGRSSWLANHSTYTSRTLPKPTVGFFASTFCRLKHRESKCWATSTLGTTTHLSTRRQSSISILTFTLTLRETTSTP